MNGITAKPASLPLKQSEIVNAGSSLKGSKTHVIKIHSGHNSSSCGTPHAPPSIIDGHLSTCILSSRDNGSESVQTCHQRHFKEACQRHIQLGESYHFISKIKREFLIGLLCFCSPICNLGNWIGFCSQIRFHDNSSCPGPMACRIRVAPPRHKEVLRTRHYFGNSFCGIVEHEIMFN